MKKNLLGLLIVVASIMPITTNATWSTEAYSAWQYSITNGQTYCSTCTQIGVFARGANFTSREAVGFQIPDEPFTKARLVIPVRNGMGPASTTASVNLTYDPTASLEIEGNLGWLPMNVLGMWTKSGPAQRTWGTWKAAATKNVQYGVTLMTIPLNAKTVADMNARLGSYAGFGIWLEQKRIEVVEAYGEDPHFVYDLDNVSNIDWQTQCRGVNGLGCASLQVFR